MNDEQDPITDFDLVAYADGKLDPGRAERVRRHIAEDPELAETVEAYLAQNAVLHEAYSGTLSEEPPARLHEALAAGGPSTRVSHIARAAVVAALILAGGLSGWMLGRSSEASNFGAKAFAQDAAATHSGSTPPAATVQGSDTAALRWLTQRISLELTAPDLSDEGYTLVQRHKVELNGEPAVHLAYQASNGDRLSVFLRRRWRETRPQILTTQAGDRTVAYWLDGPLVYGVTGESGTDRLTGIARKVDKAMSIEPKVVPGRVETRDDRSDVTARDDGDGRRGS